MINKLIENNASYLTLVWSIAVVQSLNLGWMLTAGLWSSIPIGVAGWCYCLYLGIRETKKYARD